MLMTTEKISARNEVTSMTKFLCYYDIYTPILLLSVYFDSEDTSAMMIFASSLVENLRRLFIRGSGEPASTFYSQ
jgi:hypothetical protein